VDPGLDVGGRGAEVPRGGEGFWGASKLPQWGPGRALKMDFGAI